MKVFESIYILVRYAEVIESLTQVMVDNEYHKRRPLDKKEQFHYVTLFTHILMDVNSFFDEYDNNFERLAEEDYKDRIRTVKRIAKPAVDKIREWKEIRKFRNEMISHNWRDKENNFIMSKLGDYNTPRSFHDLLYLDSYIVIIKAVILAEFDSNKDEFAKHIKEIGKDFEAPKANPDFEGEIRKLVSQVNENSLSNGRGYNFNADLIMGNFD